MLTTHQAALELGISDSRMKQFIQDGRIPTKRFGHMHMIDIHDLDILRVRRTGKPTRKWLALRSLAERPSNNHEKSAAIAAMKRIG